MYTLMNESIDIETAINLIKFINHLENIKSSTNLLAIFAPPLL